MLQKTKKQQLLPPIISDSSSEEQRALVADFKKKRFTALIMRSVLLSLTLLALLFSLFVPSMKRALTEDYDIGYSITLSVADEIFGYSSAISTFEADLESFLKNGGGELVSPDNDKEKYKSASEEQILADVAYKKTRAYSKMAALLDIEEFMDVVNYNIRRGAKAIGDFAPQDKAAELVKAYYKKSRSEVGAVFDLFSYEIERNNYAGLREFLYKVRIDLSESTFHKEAEKYLLGEYEWSEEFKTKLEIAVEAAIFLPELQDAFCYFDGEIMKSSGILDEDAIQLIFCIIIGIVDFILLLSMILSGISLYKQFRKQDAPLKGSLKMILLFYCALIHLIMFLMTKDAYLMGVIGAGAVVIALFCIFAIIAEIVYMVHLTKMRRKFLRII